MTHVWERLSVTSFNIWWWPSGKPLSGSTFWLFFFLLWLLRQCHSQASTRMQRTTADRHYAGGCFLLEALGILSTFALPEQNEAATDAQVETLTPGRWLRAGGLCQPGGPRWSSLGRDIKHWHPDGPGESSRGSDGPTPGLVLAPTFSHGFRHLEAETLQNPLW